MKKLFTIPLILLIIQSFSVNGQSTYRQTFDLAMEKYKVMLQNTGDYTYFPRTQNDNHALIYVKASDWTSGFYPATLWLIYEYSRDSLFRDRAEKYTATLEKQKNNTGTHDLGFMMYLPYGNGLRATDNPDYPSIIKQSAISLATRYNATIGGTRSWDFGNWQFPIIIDNMMNLELLFWATRHTGDSTYYNMAVSHADITLSNHFRDDFSSYHLVDFSKTTGQAIHKQTFQGYNDESSWARGQAWGLYGYVMCYRETQLVRYLEQAENIAQYFIENLPDDFVPWWDFDLTGNSSQPRDASAAAIAASALIELAQFANNDYYLDIAKNIIESLSSARYFDNNINVRGNLLLKHCTGHKPHNSEIDVPLIYADYYFIEALSRLIKMEPTSSLNDSYKSSTFTVYPNPASHHIHIASGENLKKIVVMDITGKELIAGTVQSTIDISHLHPGIYFLIGYTDKPEPTFRKKIIIQ
jgi:unsaturated chondroitin disaccharide hydrolase